MSRKTFYTIAIFLKLNYLVLLTILPIPPNVQKGQTISSVTKSSEKYMF
ncbi:hypothetical protein [Streptococcus merionis]|uniref:Uncharacterized protein n=1 Tax=Streptococcus merionis TaxID=400065 RepID=A0A239SZ25_9STRE|nr:hypothetical protein [Streptococcus merionis]SNU90731.1 Uncharacterised protein [Streptococcus merionis]